MPKYWEDYVSSEPELIETCKALDTIDIYSYLIDGMNVSDIMDSIENEYNDKYQDPPFKGEIFNWFSTDDFMEYCTHRYENVHWYEDIKYYVRKNKNEINK